MPIAYYPADDVRRDVEGLVSSLTMEYIDPSRVICYRSTGSRSRRLVARCYSLSKIWQEALKVPSYYIIEVISERYDLLPEEERIKVLIHELMHIPRCFGGGLRPHSGCVTQRAVEENYRRYLSMRGAKSQNKQPIP